jgi:acetylglutamate kinase
VSVRAPLVIKLGGAAIDRAGDMAHLWRALARLHRAELDASGGASGIAIVHGGGAAVDRLLGALGLPVVRHEGLRVTPEDQIDHVVSVLAGTINAKLVGALTGAGARAVGLSLADGGLSEAEAVSEALGRVGRVTGGAPGLVRCLWRSGFLPVVSSIGADADGAALNINADDGAGALARILGARAVVFLTDVGGVLDASGSVIGSLTRDEGEALIADATIAGGMIAKVRAASRAAELAGTRAIIASWNDPDVLVVLAAGRTPGTAILATASPRPAPEKELSR